MQLVITLMGSCGFIMLDSLDVTCKTFTGQELSCHSQRSQPRSPQRSGAGAMFELGECQSGVPASSNQFSKKSRGLRCFSAERQRRIIRDGTRSKMV